LAARRADPDRAALRLRGDRDARRALAGVGALDRGRGGDALHASDARLAGIETLDALWPEWERWIVDVGETHYTHPMLVFFRSSEPWHSWVTATATLLEAANFRLSAIQASGPGNAAAWMFYRAGLGAVQRLRGFFDYRVADREVEPVDRAAFEGVLVHLEEIGVPLVDDHEVAWKRFCSRRADYEPLVDALARLVDAPAGLWPAHDHVEAVASPSGR